jgi:hypothetical protein
VKHRRRFLVASALVLPAVGLVGVAPPARAQAVSIFRAEASAAGVVISVDRTNQLPFTPTVEQALSRTTARVSSNHEELATAAFYDPGEIARTGPRLLPLVCSTLQLPVLPLPIEIPLPALECPELPPELVYPFYAQADGANPGPVDKGLAAPIDLPPLLHLSTGQASAVVAPDGTAAAARASFGGGSSSLVPVPVNLGVSTSEATTRVEGDRVIATSLSEITGVDLAGLLTIGSMRLKVEAVALPGGEHTVDIETAYEDVMLGGTPVKIGPEGLEVSEGTSAGGDLLDQVAALLDFATGQTRGHLEFRPPEVVEGPGGTLVVDGGGFRYSSANPDPLGEVVSLVIDIGQVHAEVTNGTATAAGPAPGPGTTAPPAVAAGELPPFSGGTMALPLAGLGAPVSPPTPALRPSAPAAVSPVGHVARVLDVAVLRALYSLVASMALASATLAGWRAHAQAAVQRERLHAHDRA